MINCEKDLEDYICNNQEQFINELKKIYGQSNDIIFVGRQVRIGENNIADLVYYFDCKNEFISVVERNFIIVELKYRELEPKDLAQISRYMNILKEKLFSDGENYENVVNGLFVSFGQNELMQDISLNISDSNIDFLCIKNDIKFEKENWHYKEKYIENINLDKRILNLYGVENE